MNLRSLCLSLFFLAATSLAPPPIARAATATYYAPDSRITPAVPSLCAVSAGTVHVAANTLTDPAIVGSLCSASSRGCSVTCVLNLSGGTLRSIAAQQLAASGCVVYSSTMSDTIGNHLLSVNGGTVAVGNYYYSATSQQIGNWLAIVPDPSVTAAFDATFAGLVSAGTLLAESRKPLARATTVSACSTCQYSSACPSCPRCPCQLPPAAPSPSPVWFSPHGGCDAELIRAISAAQKSIRCLAYTSTSVSIFNALGQAARRGVDVQIVADKDCAADSRSQLKLAQQGGALLFLDGAEKIMHDKVLIVDERVTYTGSYNYSTAAESLNAENLVRLDDPDIAAAFLTNWQFHRSHSSAAPAVPKTTDPALNCSSPSTHQTARGPLRRLVRWIRSRR